MAVAVAVVMVMATVEEAAPATATRRVPRPGCLSNAMHNMEICRMLCQGGRASTAFQARRVAGSGRPWVTRGLLLVLVHAAKRAADLPWFQRRLVVPACGSLSSLPSRFQPQRASSSPRGGKRGAMFRLPALPWCVVGLVELIVDNQQPTTRLPTPMCPYYSTSRSAPCVPCLLLHLTLRIASALSPPTHSLDVLKGLASHVPCLADPTHQDARRTAFPHTSMATDMMPSAPAAADAAAASTQKMSRYRSVRRAQEQHTRPPAHCSQHHQPSHPAPLMPAVPDSPPQNDVSLSRSMSRYHRRPVTSHATSPQPPLQRLNPDSDDSEPPLPQSPPSASRYRTPGSPYHSSHAANTAQRRPRSSNARGEASPPPSDAPRQLSLRSDDSAREILAKEKERQRQLREKHDADARAKKQARQAELDRAEKLRQEEDEAARLREQQREAQEAADARRRQREEQKAEQERGRRLQKVDSRKASQSKEERQRQPSRAPPPLTSPTVSPPRQQDVGVGMFKRRKDDALGLDAPAQLAPAPQLSLSLDSHADETIRPGGGGVVRNIDAPTSAVNAGDRVCSLLLRCNNATNRSGSALPWFATRSASCYQSPLPLRPWT